MTKKTSQRLAAIGDHSEAVDWWFIYKVPKKSICSNGAKAKGTEYLYYDNNQTRDTPLALSENHIDDAKSGALANTLNQIYNQDRPDMGWFFYNDEDPLTGKTNGSRGHTKGALAFDLETNSGFWLLHSTPKFAKNKAYAYPETAVGNGQTFLCITLKDAEEAKKIAAQLYQGQQPNVYLASKIPKNLVKSTQDPRVQLLNNIVSKDKKPYADAITFLSAAGKQFMTIAKNKHWNKKNDDDFYNDLVAIKLNENMEVETWEHGTTPEATDRNSNHVITAMKSICTKTSPSYTWSEENDHAKLAISDRDEAIKYVCVGDLNFTLAQEKRSGGTVAFPCVPLWAGLDQIFSDKNIIAKKKKLSAVEN